MSKLKTVLAAFVVVTVAVTLLYTLAPSPTADAPQPTEATGLVLRGYDSGNVTWETQAGRGQIDSAAGALADVVLRVFDGAASTLEVSAGELTQEDGSVTLTGDVRAETGEGVRISSERMTWRENERTLEAAATLLTLRGDELQADGLTYNARIQHGTLVGVRATLAREDPLSVSSDEGEITREEIRLLGNVRMTSEDETLRPDALEATALGPGLAMTADSLVLSPDGLTARGSVSIDIRFAPQGEDHGA
jgi:lipopolysaccharide export system protein LptA